MVLEIALKVIGGLGIFLIGMRNMSDGIQAIAGDKLRKLIASVTNNRIFATVVGILVTCLVQSSSITTVMVVGFVNSGIMTLMQAIGVIMGANIGTTITGWILVLKIGKYGLPILGIAGIVHLFTKKEKLHYIAMAIMGVGMVFYGLEIMKNGFSSVKGLPEFEAWFLKFTAENYIGVLKCALVGALLTFIVQSSSATLGITIGLASEGLIDYPTAAALVLGENIGTTITALIASIGATTNAKRAAYFHTLFNICGVIWISLIFFWYTSMISSFAGIHAAYDPVADDGMKVTGAIAMTHSIFNIANTLFFLPFVALFGKFLMKLVPDKKELRTKVTGLDVRLLELPVMSIQQSRNEIIRMADSCEDMMNWTKTILSDDVSEVKSINKVLKCEDELDHVQDEIIEFLTELLSANIPHDVTDKARAQLKLADEYESVSDYIIPIVKGTKKLHDASLKLPSKEKEKVLELHNDTAEYLKFVNSSYKAKNDDILNEAHQKAENITKKIKDFRHEQLVKMSEAKLDAVINIYYSAMLNAYRRVSDHVLNIAEAMTGKQVD